MGEGSACIKAWSANCALGESYQDCFMIYSVFFTSFGIRAIGKHNISNVMMLHIWRAHVYIYECVYTYIAISKF